MAIYALLVGINTYESKNKISTLRGCENDVALLTETLQKRYKLPEKNIKKLFNSEATKLNIVDSFRTHLAQANAGDTALFYFSGHGSEEVVDRRFLPLSPKGHNETFVCYDSFASDPYALADKEMRYLIHELTERDIKVVTLVDSCHSGGSTRVFSDDSEPQLTRQVSGTQETRPLESYIFYNDDNAKVWLQEKDFSNMPEGEHIAMAACRDDQLAKEMYDLEHNRYQGAFTSHLCRVLRYQQLPPSYRNLLDATQQLIKSSEIKKQTPQLDVVSSGDLSTHASFLSDTIEPIVYTVTAQDGEAWLSAGVTEGINHDAVLEITVNSNTKLMASVQKVYQGKSQLSFFDKASKLKSGKNYNAEVIDPAIPKLAVTFTGDQELLRDFRATLEDMPARYYIEESDKASYELLVSNRTVEFQRKDNSKPIDAPKIFIREQVASEKIPIWMNEAFELMIHMAKWHRTMNIVQAVGHVPKDLIQLELEEYNPVSEAYTRILPINNHFRIQYKQDPDAGGLISPSIRLALRLNTEVKWSGNAYVQLLFLDPVTGLVWDLLGKSGGLILNNEEQIDYDNGDAVSKHSVTYYPIPASTEGGDGFRLYLPDILNDRNINEVTDFFKLWVSNEPINVSSLSQGELYRSISARSMKSMKGERGELKALTQTLSLTIEKPPTPQYINKQGAISLGKNIKINPHNVNAVACLESADDATESDTAIWLSFGNDASKAIRMSGEVTAENPLEIEVNTSLEDHEVLFAFTKENIGINEVEDDFLLLPLGFGQSSEGNEKSIIAINDLPSPSLVNSRSLGGSIKIYLKKVTYDFLKLENDTTQLAIPEFNSSTSISVSSYETDNETLKTSVAGADKVILIIHGIIGDTKHMAGIVNLELEGSKLSEEYLALTFDYENLNTPIPEIAEILAEKLDAIGLGSSHEKELVIVAHSMGGLVSRWMIEQLEQAPVVSKLIMCGTPNGGSPWSDVKNWAYGIATLQSNKLLGKIGIGEVSVWSGVTGVGLAVLAKFATAVDNNLDAMNEKSKIVKSLSDSPDPNVRYYLIAGNVEELRINLKETDGKLNKLLNYLKERGKLAVYDLLTKQLFEEANDIAVGQDSMKQISANRQPKMEVQVVDCDHLSYFNDQSSTVEIVKFIRSEN